MKTPRDQLREDLASGFGDADFDPWDLLELDNEAWEYRTRRIALAHPQLAPDLLSIRLGDVAAQWRQETPTTRPSAWARRCRRGRWERCLRRRCATGLSNAAWLSGWMRC